MRDEPHLLSRLSTADVTLINQQTPARLSLSPLPKNHRSDNGSASEFISKKKKKKRVESPYTPWEIPIILSTVLNKE